MSVIRANVQELAQLAVLAGVVGVALVVGAWAWLAKRERLAPETPA